MPRTTTPSGDRPKRRTSRSRSQSRRHIILLNLESLESRRLLTTYSVTNTLDNGNNLDPIPHSLRWAIEQSNGNSGPNNIDFEIPAGVAPEYNNPVIGFNPDDQTWKITPEGALPEITTPVDIDGYTEANVGVPYLYPDDITSSVQTLVVNGATGGTFTLSDSLFGAAQTPTISYDPTTLEVQNALESLFGQGNVNVTGPSGSVLPGGTITITFQEAYGEQAIPTLTANNGGLDPTGATADIQTATVGGFPGEPTMITSVPNSSPAIGGNNAQTRVIIDGSDAGGGAGFVLGASYSMLRGLIIDHFGVGVDIPDPSDVGDSIQGDFIGSYLTYAVDPDSGTPLASPDGEVLVETGNTHQGVIIDGANSTLGGASPQDDNVVAGNGDEGVWIQSGALGTQVLGNQIGVIGPSAYGVYWSVGNGQEGVLVQSSSDLIGVAGAGNIISKNDGDGVQLDQGATQVQIAGNYIGEAPGGGFVLGNPDPGNDANGVDIIGAANNTVGGRSAAEGNAIASNGGNGVEISGATATGNVVSYNLIGVSADGSQAVGNGADGVVIKSSQAEVGPGNVISGNMVGVAIAGSTITGITVIGDLIGTDSSGEFDLGNAFQGIVVAGATGVTIQGDGAGSQVISGNNVGIDLTEGASGTLIEGTFIGTDKTGSIPLPNAQQGILIEQGSWDNTIGGTASGAANVISANHYGIVIDGGQADGSQAMNSVVGNLIGTDLTGKLPLGDEIDGIELSASSGDTIGGTASIEGNTIAFNTDDGVDVIGGNADTIESNSIFSNGALGIGLDDSANDGIAAPSITAALPDTALAVTEIDLTYIGAASSVYLVQYFSTPGSVAQAGVEGETYLGSTTVKTDATGALIGLVNGVYSIDVPVVVATGDWVTATVTVLSTSSGSGVTDGDTSEFFNLPIPPNPPLTQATNPFLVTSLADTDAIGTLREAITFSNMYPSPLASNPNDIQFQIAGVGLQTIELQATLPPITASVIIDGYSQPGSQTNNSSQLLAPDTLDDQQTDIASIMIQVDGSEINSTTADGLVVDSPVCTIDGLSLTGFGGAAIVLGSTVSGSSGDTVWGDFIGVTHFSPQTTIQVQASTNPYANGVGILVDSPNNLIGGSSPPDRDVIQGNQGDGVIIYGAGTGNTIASDFILDNGGDGVLLLSASNDVGQASGQGLAGSGNLISGNQGDGVHILGPSAQGNSVANDEIGTQVGTAGQLVPALGTTARGNGGDGVLIEDAPANTIGGLVANSANVISGNTFDGITIENLVDGTPPSIVSPAPPMAPNTLGTRNVVEGNLIGYNDQNDAVEKIGNGEDGINILSSSNTVGGTVAAAQNIIVDNGRDGITIASVASVVDGNYIGTVSGSDNNGNTAVGILLDDAGSNTVGGSISAAGNVVANNASGIVILGSLSSGNVVEANLVGTSADGQATLGNKHNGIAIVGAPANTIGGTTAGAANVIAGNPDGVYIDGQGATDNLIEGDFIGTNADDAGQLGNSADGVAIDQEASNNTIGGTASGAADVITNNGGAGVDVLSGTGNSILSDSISSNAGTGIVLVGGANDAQVAPAIASATPLTTSTLVSGTIQSAASTTFLIQVFTNTSADSAGSFEGQVLVGSTTVTTDGSGYANFGISLSGSIPVGAAITATATNLTTGDTSAFSGDAVNAPLIAFSASTYYVSEPDGSATITVTRNTSTGNSTVVYAALPGSAIANVDFTSVTAALTFAPGQTSATFDVPIIATQGRLGEFTVDLLLSNPTGAGLGSPGSAVLTITSSPGTLEFSTAAVTVPESGGGVTITVNRIGGASGTVGVSYYTAAVNAIPGEDYVAVSGTLTFPPGVNQETFTLPVLGNSPNPDDATVAVVLSDAAGGAGLGAPTTELVTIDKPLIVTGEQLAAGGKGITSVTLSFNKPLNPAQAGNLANFGFFVYWANASGIFTGGGTTTPLAAAEYNPANLSLTLVLSSVLPFGHVYGITVDGSTSPVLGNGLSDVYGGLLEGSSGVPGTPYELTFSAGTKVTYSDGQGNVVTLHLHRGGIVSLFQTPDGAVSELSLIGAIPRRSTLTGSVRRGRGGTGRTTLPPISGANGVRIHLKARPFALTRAALVKGEGKPFARRAWHR